MTAKGPNHPIRQKSAHGQPMERNPFARRCRRCGASFIGLAAGKTGKRGLWLDGVGWFCSQEDCDAHRAHDWIEQETGR